MANNSIKHSSETYNDLAEFIEDSAFYKIFWSKRISFYGKEMKKTEIVKRRKKMKNETKTIDTEMNKRDENERR